MKQLILIFTAIIMTLTTTVQTLVTGQPVTTASGLQVELISSGDGEKPVKGDKVSVHYTGRLIDSTKFDSSVDRGMPFEFSLGMGHVIRGWDEGIAMLRTGDKARFVIPPSIGYGDRATGSIPANSTLVFDVELLGFKPGARPYDVAGKDTVTTQTGLQYIIVSKGGGIKVTKGMKVKVHYSGYLLSGDKFDSSVDRGQPIEIIIGKRQVIAGWEEGLAYLNVGDRARLIIPYQLAYGEAGRAPAIPPKATLIFDVEMVDAEEVERPKPYDVTGLNVEKTKSGLQYVIINKTEGTPAKAGSKVKVHYTGFFESGEIFDSSVERGQPFEFVLGQGQVIKGWDEGVQLLNKGEKARFIIPWNLGYGENGYGPIPAKATLIFDVELLDLN